MRKEIDALEELIAFEERIQKTGVNGWVMSQKSMLVDPLYLAKYDDLRLDSLEEHKERLERDLRDLKNRK